MSWKQSRNDPNIYHPKDNGEKSSTVRSAPQNVNQQMLDALRAAQTLFLVALPKFNWGASCLDAQAISLLNSVPGQVKQAIDEAERTANQ